MDALSPEKVPEGEGFLDEWFSRSGERCFSRSNSSKSRCFFIFHFPGMPVGQKGHSWREGASEGFLMLESAFASSFWLMARRSGKAVAHLGIGDEGGEEATVVFAQERGVLGGPPVHEKCFG